MRCFVVALIALSAAGCVSVEKPDPRPGGMVFVATTGLNWLPNTQGNVRPGTSWVLVRIIAPSGANECSAEYSILHPGNPNPKARPGPSRAVMLAVPYGAREWTFMCQTPAVAVRRTVASEHVVSASKAYNGRPEEHSYWIAPPLVHVDPNDPEAAVRWDALPAEICGAPHVIEAQTAGSNA